MDFNIGDTVELNEDFEGSITVAGWDRNDIGDCTFKVASLEEFMICNPKIAKRVKDGRTGNDIFLMCLRPNPTNKVFVMYPKSALILIDKAKLICDCCILRLWRGDGHYASCPEA